MELNEPTGYYDIPRHVKAGEVDGRDVLYIWDTELGEYVEIARSTRKWTEHILFRLNKL